jgi:hypothetical protein
VPGIDHQKGDHEHSCQGPSKVELDGSYQQQTDAGPNQQNQIKNPQKIDNKTEITKTTRRKFLKKSVAAGLGAAVAAPTLFNIRTAAVQGTTWRIQTSWPGGIGLEIFKSWCNSIQEKSGGELIFKPFTAKLAVPLWFKWANRDKYAAQVFKIQLDCMMSGSLGYAKPDMIKGQTLKFSS